MVQRTITVDDDDSMRSTSEQMSVAAGPNDQPDLTDDIAHHLNQGVSGLIDRAELLKRARHFVATEGKEQDQAMSDMLSLPMRQVPKCRLRLADGGGIQMNLAWTRMAELERKAAQREAELAQLRRQVQEARSAGVEGVQGDGAGQVGPSQHPRYTPGQVVEMSGWSSALYYLQMLHKSITMLTEEGAIAYMISRMEKSVAAAYKDRSAQRKGSNLAFKYPCTTVLFEDIFGRDYSPTVKNPERVTFLDLVSMLYSYRKLDKKSDSTTNEADLVALYQSVHGGEHRPEVSSRVVKTASPRVAWISYALAPDTIVGPFFLFLMRFKLADALNESPTTIKALITLLTTKVKWQNLLPLVAFPEILQEIGIARIALLQSMISHQLPFLVAVLQTSLERLIEGGELVKSHPSLASRIVMKEGQLAVKYQGSQTAVFVFPFDQDSIDGRYNLFSKRPRMDLDEEMEIRLGPKAKNLVAHIPLDWRVGRLSSLKTALELVAMHLFLTWTMRLRHNLFAKLVTERVRQYEVAGPSFAALMPDVRGYVERVSADMLAFECGQVPKTALFTAYLLFSWQDSPEFQPWLEAMVKRVSTGFHFTDEQQELLRGLAQPILESAERAKDHFEDAIAEMDNELSSLASHGNVNYHVPEVTEESRRSRTGERGHS